MADKTIADETAAVEPEELEAEAMTEGPATDEERGGKKRDRAKRDFHEFSFRELRRARKLFSAEEDGSEAQFAVQMAHVAAVLDLAEAVRNLRVDSDAE
jgi:hypothetical protein